MFLHERGNYVPPLNRLFDSERGCTTWQYRKENGPKEDRAHTVLRLSTNRLHLRAVRNVTHLECRTVFVKNAGIMTDAK